MTDHSYMLVIKATGTTGEIRRKEMEYWCDRLVSQGLEVVGRQMGHAREYHHYVVSDGVTGESGIHGSFTSPLDAYWGWFGCHGRLYNCSMIDTVIVTKWLDETGNITENYDIKQDENGCYIAAICGRVDLSPDGKTP